MGGLIILLFILSGIIAYFVMKVEIKYGYKLIVNGCLAAICCMWLFLTDISELSLLLLMALFCLTLLGVIAHYLTPLLLNVIGKCFAKLSREAYTPKTYEEHLQDGYRMYFCILLFVTSKTFLLFMFIASLFRLIT